MFRHSSMFKATALTVIFSLIILPFSGCGVDNTELIEGMITATGEGGEGCAFINCNGKGASWSKSGTIVVPPNAEKLIIGSVYSTDNPDLNDAEIKLTSPDGSQTITLAGGAVNATGFTTIEMTTPVNDVAIDDYLNDVLLKDLPDGATEEDWEELLARLRGFDPENPMDQVSTEVMEGLDDAMEEMEGYQNTIAASAEPYTPSDGLTVFGPQSGNWTIEASAQAEAGAFRSLAWAVPQSGDCTAIDHVAEALAQASGFANTRNTRLGDGEGEDPGGAWHLEQFRYPAPNTAEFYRAQAIDIVYKVVVWFVLRGIFTKAIDLVLKFEGSATLINMGLFKDRLKTLAIFVVATIYKEILRNAALAELWFWRVAYSMNSVENYSQIFYIGQIVEWGIFERFTFKNPDIVLGPNDFEEIRLIGGNMAQDVIERDMWGFGSANTSPKVGKWQIEPADLALVKPHGDQDGDCTVETISGQTTLGNGNLTVMIATQPAKEVIPVKVEEEKVTASTRGETWGPYTFQEGDAWKATAGGDVFAVWKGEKRTYTAILHKPDADPVTRTYPPEALYDSTDVANMYWGDNVWGLGEDEVAARFSSWRYTGLPGGTPQQALDNFLRSYSDWEQRTNEAFKYYLQWWLEIIG